MNPVHKRILVKDKDCKVIFFKCVQKLYIDCMKRNLRNIIKRSVKTCIESIWSRWKSFISYLSMFQIWNSEENNNRE